MEEISPEILGKVKELIKKYEDSGQDAGSYLEGLLHSKYLGYWEYIHLDTLLSLQNPKTDFKDEKIFILYHQITELYFKLIIHELQQILDDETTVEWLGKRIKRANAYLKALVSSFVVMIDGMDREQFLQYRMALLPASGFQSGQFREIELYATNLYNLLSSSYRDKHIQVDNVDEAYENIYWKFGATDAKTGAKTTTLKEFEHKYDASLKSLSQVRKTNNLYSKYKAVEEKGAMTDELKELFREFDHTLNIEWRLAHYKSAVRYLQNKVGVSTDATGGTNWHQYLPPRFQKIIFFPQAWSKQEQEEWGKKWVDEQLRG